MKKYQIVLIILVILSLLIWGGVWIALDNYEKGHPNEAITNFAKTIIQDLDQSKIVNTNQNNLFDIYVGDTKVLVLSAERVSRKWEVKLVENLLEPIYLQVPKNAKVSINGDAIDSSLMVPAKIPANYALVTDTKVQPQLDAYELKAFINIPEIEIASQFDHQCAVIADGKNITAYLPVSDSNSQKYTEEIQKVAEAYARYITNDGTFNNLAALLYKDTTYYHEVRNFFNDWYAHTGCDIKNMKVSNITKISENSFEGDISFDYTQLKDVKKYEFHANYHIPFIKVNDSWQAVSVQIK